MRAPPTAQAPYAYRGDPAVPAFADDKPVIIFDGTCVLCSGFAQFIMRRDKTRMFRLLAAQTPLGIALYEHFGLDPVDQESMILLEGGRAYLKADGAMMIFAKLGLPWSLTRIGRILPNVLQDRLYDLVAQNRYRLFGKRETCFRPDPAEADRFLA